jgi:hypothetical protein
MVLTKITKAFSFVSLVVLAVSSLLSTFQASAAQATPPQNINFAITKVVKDGKDYNTSQSEPRNWSFGEVLGSGDAIKYQWENTKIGVYFEKNPAVCCGYVKVFLGREISNEAFLTTTGTDDYPLKLSKFADKLKPGKNTLLMVFYDHTNSPTNNKATITFDYNTESPKPKINILKPTAGTLFSKESNQNISLELENFKLTTLTEGTNPNIGKLNLYGNTTDNLISTITTGSEMGDNKYKVEIKPDTLVNFNKLPDSKNTKLIFQLYNSTQKDKQAEGVVEVITNYNNSIDVGIPKVTIVDPSKSASIQEINQDKVITLKIDNYEIINKPPLSNAPAPDNKKGFLQIFVDNKPYQTTWTKNTFSLKEIGYVGTENGEKEIKVQLVNTNYEKLSPEASDKVKIQYQAQATNQAQVSSSTTTQTSNWKNIIIILTIILIAGGILISITKS